MEAKELNNFKDCNEIIIDKMIETGLNGNKINMHVIAGKVDYGNYLRCHIKCDIPTKGLLDHHPLSRVCQNNEKEIVEIVADNKMTREMLNHLIMTDEELRKYSGSSGSVDYRAQIIDALARLWD